MALRLLAAFVTCILQCGALWLSIFLAVKIATTYDVRHHHGVFFGLLIYYLFWFTVILLAAINLSIAIFNKSLITWLVTGLAIGVMLAYFGGDPAYTPWRMLFLLVVVTPLFGLTGWINNFVSRLLVRLGRKRELPS